MDNTCVVCGAVIPEGRQVCPACEQKHCGQLEDEQVMTYLLRQSVLKGPPGGEKIILHGQFTGDTLKSPDTTAYKAEKKQRHGTAFRRFFDFLNAFFVSGKRRGKASFFTTPMARWRRRTGNWRGR